MKKQFDFTPLTGLGPILLGMARNEVHAALGKPANSLREEVDGNLVDDWFEEELYVFYDAHDSVQYIELSAFRSEQIQVLWEGKDLFAIPAEELITGIEEEGKDAYLRESAELPYGYTFPGISISFYRPYIPKEYEDDEPDDAHGKGRYFERIGMGVAGYFEIE